MSAPTSETRSATFTLARKLRDKAFRRVLEANGYVDGMDIVVAMPDEPTSDVFGRMFTQTKPPAIIAMVRPADPNGFVFMHVAPGPTPGTENINVGAGATVGMLYDTLSAKSNQYMIPQSWAAVRRLVNA